MTRAQPSGVTVLIASYTVLLLCILGITPLWLDELWNVERENWRSMLLWIQVNPGGVPLPYLMQRGMADLFGSTAWILRLPAALCSIGGAVLFARLCPRFGVRALWATALFLVLPLQFRYALEARGYSLGLFCTLLTLLLFLRAREQGTVPAAVWFGLSVATGLYSQPLTILPVFGEMLWLIGERGVAMRTRRALLGAAICGGLAFVPWYVLQRQAQERLASMSYYFFSWRQVAPLRFLHEMSGGGYVCTAAILILAAIGLSSRARLQHRRLLVSLGVMTLAGPVAVDFLVQYFFAARQLLFAVPVLAWCAAAGVERMRERQWLRYAVLATFFGASAYADYRFATVPKDALGAQASALAANLSPGTCVAVAPPLHFDYYLALQPKLDGKVCAEPPSAARVLAVMSPYSTGTERGQLTDLLSRDYDKVGGLKAGATEIGVYRHR